MTNLVRKDLMVVGLFSRRESLERAMEFLSLFGFPTSDISFLLHTDKATTEYLQGSQNHGPLANPGSETSMRAVF